MKARDKRYEQQMQLMHGAVLDLLSRGMTRTTRFPKNGYRRRLYFEGIAILAADLKQVALTAAILVRTSGQDLQGG